MGSQMPELPNGSEATRFVFGVRLADKLRNRQTGKPANPQTYKPINPQTHQPHQPINPLQQQPPPS